MNCRDIDALLDQQGRPTLWPQTAQEHFDICPRCKALFDAFHCETAAIYNPQLDAAISTRILNTLTPVQPIASLPVRSLALAVLALALGALPAAMSGLHGWQTTSILHRAVIFPLLLLMTSIQATAIANEMVPGHGKAAFVWSLILFIPLILLGYPAFYLKPDLDNESLIHGLKCMGRGLCTYLAILGAMFFFLRKGYYVEPLRAGAAAGLVAGLGAVVSQQLYCPLASEAWHVALAHVGMLALTTAVGMLAAKFMPPA